MRYSYLCTLILTLLPISAAHSFLPDPPINLSDHIRISNYIFVAEAVDTYYVSSSGKRITPTQAVREMNISKHAPCIETKLRVRETLLTRHGRLPQFIFFQDPVEGAGYFPQTARQAGLTTMLKGHKESFSEPFIYFADAEKSPHKSIFFASYGMTTGKEFKEKAKIKAAIEDLSNSMRLLN